MALPHRERPDTLHRSAEAKRHTVGLIERISAAATEWTGRTTAFMFAVLLVIGWMLSGPLFHYSDTWQLFINTVTNLVTFLMVFLIQRAQNKDTLALQLKVNELIAAQHGARNALIAIEQLSEDELRTIHERFLRLAESSRNGAPANAPSAEKPRQGSEQAAGAAIARQVV
jgi:low affinity Fe/Cu permease